MATAFFYNQPVGYWNTTSNILRGSLYGDVRRSGNTVYLENMTFDFYPSQTSYGTSGFTLTVNGTSTSWTVSNGTLPSSPVNSTSIGVGTTQTSASIGWSTSDGYSGSFTITFPSGSTAPTGLSCSNLVASTDSFSATVSLTSWGEGATSDRYRELQVWTYSSTGLNEPRRWQHQAGNALSGTITVNNSSQTSTTPLTITPNTRYVIGIYASNGVLNTGSQRVRDAYTLCEPPTSVSLDSQVYETYDTVRVTIDFSTPQDGGGLVKTIQYRYSTDGETYTDWLSGTQVSTGSVYSGSFEGIFSTDSEISLEIRTLTSAGSSTSINTSFNTLATHTSPTFIDFDYEDTNSSVVAITGDNQVLVQNKSTLRAEVSVADKMTTFDNIDPDKYTSTYGSLTAESIYKDNESVYLNLGTPTSSGSKPLTVSAYDKLGASTTVFKTVQTIPYVEPTIDANTVRLNEAGNVQLQVSGTYSEVKVNNVVKNDITVEYKLIRDDGEQTIDWQELEVTKGNSGFSGIVDIDEITFQYSWTIQVRVTDSFGESSGADTHVANEDPGQELDNAHYDIEIWDWKTNTYITDITSIVAGDLQIDWTLNDVESVSFDLDLVQFEKRCRLLGATPGDVLTPYVHDVRIRRNGIYIVGAQIVEANISIQDKKGSIKVKASGFLNLFKDQYISEAWSGFTYGEIAQKIVQTAQKGECLIKNPTCDIDISYWLGVNGTTSYRTDKPDPIAGHGDGALFTRGSSSSSYWGTVCTQLDCPANTKIVIDCWVRATTGKDFIIHERYTPTIYQGQSPIYQETGTGAWRHIRVETYTIYENGYLTFEVNGNGADSAFWLDGVYVYKLDDEEGINSLNVPLGIDTASEYQESNRQVSYELQNAKDALMDLTALGEDNFDIDFHYDRTFDVLHRKGADKPEIEACYPGNVDSISINRSAANLANKVISIGSGIGDERLQVINAHTNSRERYGTHETVKTDNNVSLTQTLLTNSVGTLWDSKDPTNLPEVTIGDGSINCGNVETGDVITVKIQDDSYLENATGLYKIMKINVSISLEHKETLRLTLEKLTERPEPVMIRYIKDTITGSNKNVYKHWVEIQALMMVGDGFQDIALGKAASGTGTFNNPASNAVDGNINYSNFASIITSGKESIVIDLGQEYPIDYIKLWHYYGDTDRDRIYYGGECSVGRTLTAGTEPLEHILWTYPDTAVDNNWGADNMGIRETAQGRISQWLQTLSWEES